MKTKIKKNIFLAILVTFLSVSGTYAAGIGNNIVVLLEGQATADPSGDQFTQFGLEAPEGVLCFDMDLVDAKTGNIIGNGSDCLSAVTPSVDVNGDISMSLTATSFFHFPGGSLISQGQVSVRPKLHGLEGFTHVTGAAPAANENNVIYGDGNFKDAAGSVRLSGLVNLDRLFNGEGIIDFDCLFIIDIWK